MKSCNLILVFVLVFFSCTKYKEDVPPPLPPPEPEFNKVHGGSEHDEVTAFIRSGDGGYVITGYTSFGRDDDDTSTASNYKSWVLKLDSSGNKLWQKTIDDSGAGTVYAIAAGTGGGFVLGGFSINVAGGHGPSGDIWLVKIDDLGNIVWQKPLGGSGTDWAHAITATSDGGYILAGLTESNDGDVSGIHKTPFGTNSQDAWVIKINSSGNKEWQQTLGGSALDRAYAITETTDGYVMAGYTESSDGDVTNFKGYIDVWVVKLDKSGNKKWQKCLGGSSFEYATSIITSGDGGYVLAGYVASNDGDASGNHGGISDVWVVKLDAGGNKLWQKVAGGSERDGAAWITRSADGGYVVTGTTESTDGDITGYHGGTSDAWIIKLDRNGSIVWQKAVGGSYDDASKAILSRADGSFLMVGTSQSDDGDVGLNFGGFDVWIKSVQNR